MTVLIFFHVLEIKIVLHLSMNILHPREIEWVVFLNSYCSSQNIQTEYFEGDRVK